MANERQLLHGIRRLDSDALMEAYDRYSPELYVYALRQLANAGLAEDCVAETFRRLLDAVQRGIGPRRHLRAYLYRTAHNWITDNYRQPPMAALEEAGDPIDASLASPESRLSLEASRGELLQAMATLTPDQRQVLMLRFVEEWSLADTAKAMGRSVGAVKALQFRAIRSLAAAMGAEDHEA